jgi:peptide/nickel transport system permease protein
VGLVSAALLLALGVTVGALAGYHGGRVDLVLSRVIEVVQCFPTFFLIVTAVALIPERRLHPLFAVVIVIALVGWTGVARLVRAEFLRARELDYVAAARSLGFSSTRIAFGHVLPNVLGPVLVAAAFAVASGMLIESGVSFLGFGVRHPVPSWGALLSESRSLEHWWLQLFPGLLIFAAVLSTHVLGEALRERLDPRGPGEPGESGALGGEPAAGRGALGGGAAPEPLGGRALVR